jgi:hypothetical protein
MWRNRISKYVRRWDPPASNHVAATTAFVILPIALLPEAAQQAAHRWNRLYQLAFEQAMQATRDRNWLRQLPE